MARSTEIDDIFARPLSSAKGDKSSSSSKVRVGTESNAGRALQADRSAPSTAPSAPVAVGVSKNARRKLAKRAKAATTAADASSSTAPPAAGSGGAKSIASKPVRATEDEIEIVTAPTDLLDGPTVAPAVAGGGSSRSKGGSRTNRHGVEDDADAAFTDFTGSKSKRRRTEEGYLIYRADELQLDNRSDVEPDADDAGEGDDAGAQGASTRRKKSSRIDYDQAGSTPDCPFDCQCCF